jgi:twitching motility protein PilT
VTPLPVRFRRCPERSAAIGWNQLARPATDAGLPATIGYADRYATAHATGIRQKQNNDNLSDLISGASMKQQKRRKQAPAKGAAPAQPGSSLRQDLIEVIQALSSAGRTFSDLHIEQDAPLMMKTAQGWQQSGSEPIGLKQMIPLLNAIDADWEDKIMASAIDRPLQLSAYFLRCNIYRLSRARKVAVSIRGIPAQPPKLSDVGLPFYTRNLAQARQGLVLVCGPSGSGKTTTMAALLEHINQTRNVHIMTVEAPIEYRMQRKQAIISQKEVPSDTASVVLGLREAMRQNPDVLMVDDIRDVETAGSVLHASESGRLVLASMHAGGAVAALDKLLSFFPPGQREARAATLANVLVAVIFQNLLPACEGEQLILASEMMFNNNQQVATIVSDPRKFPLLVEYMRRRDDNMSYSLNLSLAELVRNKSVSLSEAMRASYQRLELHAMLQEKWLTPR